jgi:N-succinyldiaminopimelate aminotransferase
MNPALALLQAYPFEKLTALLEGVVPPAALRNIPLFIGEPRHQPPQLVIDALAASLDQLGSYPATKGLPQLRAAIAGHLERHALPAGARVDAEAMVLPVTGTREGLFSLVQFVIDPGKRPIVALPNPSYQIYEGATLLAGAEPLYLHTTAANGMVPDLDAVPAATWQRVQLLMLCSPGNPTGVVLSRDYLRHALELAERHDFVIASDECYADLYSDEAAPPPSLLGVAWESGRKNFERCLVLRSLSKRSSVPGLRSGFVAGDPALMAPYLLYRTYHGCAMPLPTQLASVVAWNDDAHVVANRALYREKFAQVLPILAPHLGVQPHRGVALPAGGFYLWPEVGDDDIAFTRELYAQQNLTLLPGSFMAREVAGVNPGRGRVRISLVPTVEDCVAAARRMARFICGEPTP